MQSITTLVCVLALLLVSACWSSEIPLLDPDKTVMPVTSSTGNLLLTCDDEEASLVLGETSLAYNLKAPVTMEPLDRSVDGHTLYVSQADTGDGYFFQVFGVPADQKKILTIEPEHSFSSLKLTSRDTLFETAHQLLASGKFSKDFCTLSPISDVEVIGRFRATLD